MTGKEFNRNFTYDEVKDLCKKHNRSYDEFNKFMVGQTGGFNEKGEMIVYGGDVENFFKRRKVYD
jgi:hypothetical protein